jgi:hypothetical protein
LKITIRESTEEEKQRRYGPRQIKFVKKYVVVNANNLEAVCHTFFLPVTANNKPEVVFWAERWASKSGATFVRPPGWERIKGKLH